MQQTIQNPAEAVATFVSTLEFDDIPSEAVRLVERAFVDTVGVMLAGTTGEATTNADRTVSRLSGGCGSATLLPSGATAPVPDAAFVNGIAGHWHDYDDVLEDYHMHPSVPLVAAILATGEETGADAESMITAFASGFETIRYLAAPINPEHYERGWHGTATYGTFSATAAVGKLLDLPAEQLAHALNIAGSLPAGLKRNFGSMTKSLHAGNAAKNGALAAYLAADSYEATPDALVGEAGFYDLYRGDSPPDLDAFPTLGESWGLVEDGIDMKKYPCCYFTHSSIEAGLRLVADHDIDPDDIDSIAVRSSKAAKSAVIHDRPSTGLEGKFSMPYVIAAAVTRGTVGLDSFTDEGIRDDDVRDLMPRISFEADPSLPFSSHAGEVTITLQDGTRLEREEPKPPGVHANPLTDAELEDKFMECAGYLLPESDARTLYRRLNALSGGDGIDDLMAPIADGRPA